MPKKKIASPAVASVSFEEELASITEPKKLPSAIAVSDLPTLVSVNAPFGPKTTENALRAMLGLKMAPGAPLVARLRNEATHDSRDALGLALLSLWEKKEFHGRLIWILDAAAALAGDRTMVTLASLVASWPAHGDSGRKHAITAAKTFALTGTDTALLALIGLRQTVVVPSVLEAVIEALSEAVDDRKTTLSELFDHVTPTMGLDQNGTRAFDHGGRALTVVFDDHFEPRLRDDSGDHIEDLDEEPAWKTLSAQLREAVKVQTFRLEQDMITGRRWSVGEWTRCLKDHPLLVSFTRRLLWGVYDDEGALVTAFRTAEDRTLTTRDGEMRLDERARIGLVHPLHLGDDARAAWSEHLADYEIIQPFAQLGRRVFRVEDPEKNEIATARYAKTKFKSGLLRDMLVRGGWDRDDAFLRREYERHFVGQRVVAIATMDPGVQAGEATYEIADQTIETIEFRAKKGRGKSTTPMALHEVPAIAFSEAVLDLDDVLVASAN